MCQAWHRASEVQVLAPGIRGAAGEEKGKGIYREVGSEGLAENHRVVIDGSDPKDEPVGQRRGMAEPARWRRRRMGSSPAYHGVCG